MAIFVELQKIHTFKEKLSTAGDKSGEISYMPVISRFFWAQFRYTQVFNTCGITFM